MWTYVRKANYWYFLVACLLFVFISVFALRQNNLNAIALRDELNLVDKQNGDVESALNKLRLYIYGHMNTNLATSTSVYPPIQLKYRYDRLVAAEKAQSEKLNTNTTYNDAQKYCEANYPQNVRLTDRLPCIKNYIDTHPTKIVEEKQIPDGLYKFNFESPVWSPDLAGWSIFFAGLLFLLFALQFVLEKWLRYEFKKHI